MGKKQGLKPLSAQKQKQYERVARLQYGPEIVNQSIQRWNSYTKAAQEKIFEESGQIYSDLVAAIEAGKSAQSPDVQPILERWHNNIYHFYVPTLEILRGLGELYNTDPAFMANFERMHPDLPAFLQEAITEYVDQLETAEIAQLLAQDEEYQRSVNRLTGR